MIDLLCDYCFIPRDFNLVNTKCLIGSKKFPKCEKCSRKTRKTRRQMGYYDLIALPDGKHVPVPIAIEIVGVRNILKIPVSRLKRDWHFYWCEECAEEAYRIGEPYDGDFYKCWWHSDRNPLDFKAKEAALKLLVENKQFYKLRYIEAIMTNGFIIVDKRSGKLLYKSNWGRWTNEIKI